MSDDATTFYIEKMNEMHRSRTHYSTITTEKCSQPLVKQRLSALQSSGNAEKITNKKSSNIESKLAQQTIGRDEKKSLLFHSCLYNAQKFLNIFRNFLRFRLTILTAKERPE